MTGVMTASEKVSDTDGELIGILDWESAGYFPVWWEYAATSIGFRAEDAEWKALLRVRLSGYPNLNKRGQALVDSLLGVEQAADDLTDPTSAKRTRTSSASPPISTTLKPQLHRQYLYPTIKQKTNNQRKLSPYSFYAFTYLQKNAAALESLGVEIEYIPVFLGGINVGSGNKPPWTLPAKAAYSKYDGKRAQKYFGHDFEVPSWFPILSLLPQRALTYIKKHHPSQTFSAAFQSCFETMWNGQLDISKPENLAKALGNVFSAQEVEKIITAAGTPEVKAELAATTERVVKELGAFGCPWFWVINGEGKGEPFFGSDRWHFMWEFLGLPFDDLKLRARI
ncbi:thioredoxin-like protein [Aspergillus transmontanensis]|uniref:Glutathione S-transferase kappa 1 n=1 Tax=Aspergillus transmontanensis TaxID=1034304 RepID=A0A5N6WDA5_9EURO|nr:thioredoxin-like protein [Aspergillus transmontanensis]